MTVLSLPLPKATQVSLSFFPSMFFVGCKRNNQPHLMYLLICGLPSYFPMNSLHCSFPNLLFSPMFPSPSILPCLEEDLSLSRGGTQGSCWHSLQSSSFLLRHFNNFVCWSLDYPLLGCFKERTLGRYFSKCGSRTCSFCILWELLRKQILSLHPRPAESLTLGWGPTMYDSVTYSTALGSGFWRGTQNYRKPAL